MAKVQATLRALATDTPSLSALAAKTNDILCRDGLPNRFATLVYVELRDNDGGVRLVNGGHMPPVLVSGGRFHELQRGDIALGMVPGAAYREQHQEVQPGEMLIAYSDGLTEALNAAGEFYGEERLHASSRECPASRPGRPALVFSSRSTRSSGRPGPTTTSRSSSSSAPEAICGKLATCGAAARLAPLPRHSQDERGKLRARGESRGPVRGRAGSRGSRPSHRTARAPDRRDTCQYRGTGLGRDRSRLPAAAARGAGGSDSGADSPEDRRRLAPSAGHRSRMDRSAENGRIQTGITDMLVAIKWRVTDAAPILGTFAIQSAVSLPTGDANAGRGSGAAGMNILAISSHRFARCLSISTRATPGLGGMDRSRR